MRQNYYYCTADETTIINIDSYLKILHFLQNRYHCIAEDQQFKGTAHIVMDLTSNSNHTP